MDITDMIFKYVFTYGGMIAFFASCFVISLNTYAKFLNKKIYYIPYEDYLLIAGVIFGYIAWKFGLTIGV